MRERPILFSAPMALATLDGSKTQTRRILKDAPEAAVELRLSHGSSGYLETFVGEDFSESGWMPVVGEHGCETPVRCPYGVPGDRLWGREACRAEERKEDGIDGVRYLADNVWLPIEDTKAAADRWVDLFHYRGQRGAVVPSIHMPRWASRILVELTDVRVERLQDISEEDAIAEGIERCPIEGWRNYLWHGDPESRDRSVNRWPHQFSNYLEARGSYSSLWERINGPGSWDANPYVWALTYRLVEA